MRTRLFLLVLGTLALPACSVGQDEFEEVEQEMVETEAEVETIAAEDLDALLDSGDVILIDVRTPYEFADGRIAGALNAPLTHFDPSAIPVDDERETILYCGSDRRSGIAAEQMAEHWGMPVRHLAGGITAWEEAGLEVVANSPDDDPRED